MVQGVDGPVPFPHGIFHHAVDLHLDGGFRDQFTVAPVLHDDTESHEIEKTPVVAHRLFQEDFEGGLRTLELVTFALHFLDFVDNGLGFGRTPVD